MGIKSLKAEMVFVLPQEHRYVICVKMRRDVCKLKPKEQNSPERSDRRRKPVVWSLNEGGRGFKPL